MGKDTHGFRGWSSQDVGEILLFLGCIDRLTKSAHFILIRADYNIEQLVGIYVNEILRLHVVPLSIISYNGTFHISVLGEVS